MFSPLLAVLFFWVLYAGIADGITRSKSRQFWEEQEDTYE